MKKSMITCQRGLLPALSLFLSLAGVLGQLTTAAQTPFGVPVRAQFNFILNASGNRPGSGDINTDAEVEAQVARANEILSTWTSELRIHNLGIQEVSGASQYYSADTDDRDAIRNAARADPNRYHWRTDAVNIYITAASDSARSDFPPDNNIIIVCQSIFDTTVMHELGHSLSLYHTHETCCGGDGCSDTLADDDSWDRDDISVNNYGKVYSQLTSTQQTNVNMVWFNLMSYHNGDNRWMISNCQLDKLSTTASSDQNWLLTRIPVYVDAAATGGPLGIIFNGTFPFPFRTVQNAINGGLNNRVLVLDQGTHADPASVIITDTDAVPRKGTAVIRESKPKYDLPYTLEESKNLLVRNAFIRAQQADRQNDIAAVIANLLEAEKHAQTREKQAIQLELAQRFRDSGEFDKAAAYFGKLAAETDQLFLRKRVIQKVGKMKVLKEKAAEQKSQSKKDLPNEG